MSETMSNADILNICLLYTHRIDADIIMRSLQNGEITESAAVCIAKAEKKIIDFVDQDYKEHIEEYYGCLPIWGDHWDYITDFLIDKAQKGMAGEDILATVDKWIKKGAYHSCAFQTAFEEKKFPLFNQIESAASRATKSGFCSNVKSKTEQIQSASTRAPASQPTSQVKTKEPEPEI